MAQAQQSPGAFLALMLEKYKLNPLRLSKDIYMSQSAVRLITNGKAKITTPVAMRLAKYFNTNPEFWLAMQMKWDVGEAGEDKALMKIIKNISRVEKNAAGSGGTSSADKKATAAKKPVAKKKAAAKKKPVVMKKTAAAKKTTQKRTAKKPAAVAKKKPITKKRASGKKAVVRKVSARTARKPSAARKKPSVRRGRSRAK
ncbi:MAG: HigA family addiction module antidote protein [Treponema sp.]|nr:HigA family addiction module antidote protein [Treponema sp.]